MSTNAELVGRRIGREREKRDWSGGIADHPSDLERSMLVGAIRDEYPRLSVAALDAAVSAYMEARRARFESHHSPKITDAMSQRGFSILNSGGNTLSYTKHDPTAGSVSVVHGDGHLPLRLSDPVDVFFFGLQHSEPLLMLHFGTLTAFLRSLDEARP
jgi:hypothetical protein